MRRLIATALILDLVACGSVDTTRVEGLTITTPHVLALDSMYFWRNPEGGGTGGTYRDVSVTISGADLCTACERPPRLSLIDTCAESAYPMLRFGVVFWWGDLEGERVELRGLLLDDRYARLRSSQLLDGEGASSGWFVFDDLPERDDEHQTIRGEFDLDFPETGRVTGVFTNPQLHHIAPERDLSYCPNWVMEAVD